MADARPMPAPYRVFSNADRVAEAAGGMVVHPAGHAERWAEMMITNDDPRLSAAPDRAPPAVPDAAAGDRTVRDQLTCHRGKWRLNQLGPDEFLGRWLLSAVRARSSRRCAARFFNSSGCMCLLLIPLDLALANTMYLDCWACQDIS
jgi:hypothetical protein